MKKTLILFIFSLIPFSIFAGSFGLTMGMSMSDITKVCGGNRPEHIDNDDRYFIIPDKNHSTSGYYFVLIIDYEFENIYKVEQKEDSVL